MLNLNSLLIFSEKPDMLVAFYKNILGAAPAWEGGDFTGFQVGNSYLMIGPHDKVKGPNRTPERIIFNFETTDVEGEFARMIRKGAEEIKKPYHPDEAEEMLLATLADIDGNYFQLASPMK